MSVTATTTQQLKQGTAKFWIVLVGVNRYKDSNILNLRYCANDCKELAEALEIATGEFQHAEIISLYDGGNLPPERSQIINSIQQFRFAKPEDTVLFYFSGHGYLDSNNRPVLCVADTRLDNLAETGLKLDFLLNELSQCRAQRQLVWLDACQEREQQPDNQIKQNPTQQLSAALEEQARKSQNFYAMLSCDKQERSWEIEELRHGLFTYCLIEGLQGKAANSKNQIDADGLFDYVERMTSHIIEDRKNPGAETLSKGMMINVQQIKQSSPPPKTKRLPANASQTPKRIVQGGGKLVFLIGLAAPIDNRKALICDRLSNSEADIKLCKLLQAQGNFAVEYRYLRDKQQWQLQQDIIRYLVADNRTVLLYLSGTIESTTDRGYELVGDSQHRINLNWLAKELKASPVREIVLIANITKATETTPSLESILQLNYDLPLCLIEATSHRSDREFLARLVTTLSTAAKTEREFWVTDLFSPLQKWSLEQPDIEVTGWWGTVGIIEILSVEVQRSYNQTFDIEVCPYKSLEAFTQDDAYFFHGREELITKIIEKLKFNSFLAVVGASGSGKSSVVRAGVVPKLIANGLNTTSSQQVQACQTWVMLPGDSPFTALAKVIAPNEPELIEGVLHAGIKGFVDWLRQLPQAISVLAIDQFEELFTLTPEKERIDFIKLIIAAVERAGDCFKVIITLRGDFINECLNLSEIAPLMEQNEILVPVKSSRLEDNQYRQIIAQPARKVGLEVEDGLMAVLLEELKDGSLPLLQYALEELWQKRREGKLSLKDYQQHIGRLGQFLSDKAEATYQNLNQLQQECAQSIFLSLVYLAQEQDKTNKDTRRRLLKSDLRVNKYKDTLDDTLQALVDARLIVVSVEDNSSVVTQSDRTNALTVANEVKENTSDRDKDTVEIAHEILIDNWKTLKWWLDNNRDKYRLIREINQKARDWKQNNQQEGFLLSKGALAKYEEFYGKYADELSSLSDRFMDTSIQARDKADKLAKRRQRQIIGGLTGGITVLTAALIFALGQLRRATINEVDALINSTEALRESDRELDSLVLGLKIGKRINKSLFINEKTKTQLLSSIQNSLYQVKEFNRIEQRHENAYFSPNGQVIATIDEDQVVKIWNDKGKKINTFKGYRNSLYFSNDSKFIANQEKSGIIKLRNSRGELIKEFQGQTISDDGDFYTLVFNSKNNFLASISYRKKDIKFYNLTNGKTSYFTPQEELSELNISNDFKIIAATTRDGYIKIWNRQGKLLNKFYAHDYGNPFLFFSPDNKTIISFSFADSTVKLWDFQGNLLERFEAYPENFGINISPDGRFIAVWTDIESEGFKLWDVQEKSGKTVFTNEKHIDNIIFSLDNNSIAFIGNKITLWNQFNRGYYYSSVKSIENPEETKDINFITSDVKTLASVGDDVIKLWKLKGYMLPPFDKFVKEDYPTEFKKTNGKIIATANYGNENNASNIIALWNLKGEFISKLKGHEDKIEAIEFSPNGNIIASSSKDNLVKLWNIDGELITTLYNKNVSDIIRFSPDSKFLAIADNGNDSKIIKILNIEKRTINIIPHNENIRDIKFNHNGKIIASIVDDKVKLWNINGKLLRDLPHRYIDNFVFSSEDNTIITQSSIYLDNIKQSKVQFWNLEGKILNSFSYSETDSAKPDTEISVNAKEVIVYHENKIDIIDFRGKLIRSFAITNSKDVTDIKINSNTKTIATYNGKIIQLWNFKGKLVSTFPHQGEYDYIADIKWHPNGKIIASIEKNKTLKLWNFEGELVSTFKHIDGISRSDFFIDKDNIITTTSYGEVRLWSLDLDEVMSRGCDWVRYYLENNSNVSEEDRKICDGY